MRNLLRYWLPLLIWSAMILSTSNDTFSSPHTGGIISGLLSHFLTPQQIDVVNVCFRKTAHVAGYGILGGLGFRAVRGERRGYSTRWAIAGIAIAVLVASIDEWHQTLIPSRGGSAADVLLDACGAAVAQLIAALRNARR
jgi:VanZ family protein